MLLFRSRFPAFPLTPGLISRAFFPVLCTWLSVSFLSSYPASLPQLLHRCLLGSFPFRFPLFSIFPFFSAFFRPLLFRFRLLSFRFFFSLLPCPASRWPFRCLFICVLFRLFPCFRFRFGTQLFCISFLRSLLRVTALPQLPASCFQLGCPLSFRLRFRLLGRVMHPQN